MAGAQGQAGWRKEPKGRQRVSDKLIEYDNDASDLKDLAAARVQFEQLADIYSALERLMQVPGVVILNIKDRFLHPQPSGYRDVLLNLRMSNGHVAELRLHLADVDEVAKWEHALYEVRRDVEALAELEGRPLTDGGRAVRAGLLRKGQEAFWRAVATNERED